MQTLIDRTYLSFLECRFKGAWEVDSQGNYVATGEDAELRVVRLDGLKKYLAFKKEASVLLSSSNVIRYEHADVEEDVDVEEESSKNP